MGKQKHRFAITRDASDLAFHIGQEVQQALRRLARAHTLQRNAEVVSVADIQAAIAELNLHSIQCGGQADGERAREGSSAA